MASRSTTRDELIAKLTETLREIDESLAGLDSKP
jgi:hypothetical protein